MSRDEKSERRLVISLFLSRIATRPSGILIGFILIDVGLTFGCSVGVMGQIITAASILGMIMALLMGVLSIRYDQKLLLIIGLTLISASAIGCFLAPNYLSMLFAYSLNGIGAVMVAPMTIALVGEHLTVDKRPNAIGLIVASTPILSVLTGFIIGYIIKEGWRLAYLKYVFPLSLLSLLAAMFGIPRTKRSDRTSISKSNFLMGFKEIFTNRSAVACLFGAMLSMASWMGIMYYGMSFYRQRFLLPTELAGIIWSGLAFCFAMGSVLSGRLVTRFGRKPSTYLSVLLLGFFTLLYTNVPAFWLSVGFALLISFCSGLTQSAGSSLTIEQVPEFRGSMMSINSAASNLGSTLGTAVGGMALLLWGYEGMGISQGIFGIIAGITYMQFTMDPTRIQP